jgi:peroxiredoxin
MLAEGSQAPSFTLSWREGGTASFEQLLAGGPVLLTFYKINCPTCQLAMPYLDRIGGGKLRVVAISQNNPADTAAFEKRYGIVRVASLIDDESTGFAAAKAYGLSYVPSQFVIERDGRIAQAWAGFSREDLEKAGERAGVRPFGPGDNVPSFKAG